MSDLKSWRDGYQQILEEATLKWRDLFYPRGIKQEDVETVLVVRDAFAKLAEELEAKLPEGRYKAIVKTDLEKVAAIATKAFTHEEPRKS